jgi:succinate dehydrogenase / fumarate reductase membrane anchor subunit
MSQPSSSLRTPVARARGLGSAKEGVHHWWVQRLTALALIPLSLWFVASVIGLAGAEHSVVVAWLGNPLVAILMVLLITAVFYHAALGMQVVYEDYVHPAWLKITVDVATKFACLALGVASIFSVLKIAFAG